MHKSNTTATSVATGSRLEPNPPVQGKPLVLGFPFGMSDWKTWSKATDVEKSF